MLYLKEVNYDDANKQYNALKKFPRNENGFENIFYNISEEDFYNIVIPKLIDSSNGINLKEGHVPETYYFLWNDDEIVGLFKIRHRLNDFLRTGPGHIGYGILQEHRGKGYATIGLKLAVDICKDLIEENEIYFSVNKDNIASLIVQQRNGAVIVDENDKDYFTRIKIR